LRFEARDGKKKLTMNVFDFGSQSESRKDIVCFGAIFSRKEENVCVEVSECPTSTSIYTLHTFEAKNLRIMMSGRNELRDATWK
jgi:hypothetical protein